MKLLHSVGSVGVDGAADDDDDTVEIFEARIYWLAFGGIRCGAGEQV